MRVFVQRTDTKEFYLGPGIWTRSSKAAFDFGKGRRAEEFCRAQQGGTGLCIVFKFPDNKRPDIFLPIQSRPATLENAQALTH